MAVQVTKLLELSASGKVRTQIIFFSIGAYSVADIIFTVLFVEGLVGSQYYERPLHVTASPSGTYVIPHPVRANQNSDC